MRKKKLIVLKIFVAIILVCSSVYATLSTTINVTTSNQRVSKGDVVTVKLSLANVDSSKPVESVEGYINYNTDVIEALSANSIRKNNNTITIGNQTLPFEDLTNANASRVPETSAYVAFNGSPASNNNSKIVIDFKDPITSDVDLLNIDFKVKSDATTGEIENAISYAMFLITSGSDQTEEITKNITLTITERSSDDNNNENKNDNNNGNTNKDNTNANSNKDNTNANSNKDNTNANSNKGNTNANSNKDNTNANGNKGNTNANSNKGNTNANGNSNKSGGAAASTNNSGSGTANKALPAAGSKLFILPMFGLLAIAYIFYNKYMRYEGI